jgi:hypothetical protein
MQLNAVTASAVIATDAPIRPPTQSTQSGVISRRCPVTACRARRARLSVGLPVTPRTRTPLVLTMTVPPCVRTHR